MKKYLLQVFVKDLNKSLPYSLLIVKIRFLRNFTN